MQKKKKKEKEKNKKRKKKKKKKYLNFKKNFWVNKIKKNKNKYI